MLTDGELMNSEQQAPANMNYLRLLRKHGLLVVILTVVCGAAALGISKAQKPSYTAQASESIQDPSEQISALGGSGGTNQTPAELAAAHAPQVTRLQVAQLVKADLRSSVTPAQLAASVSVSTDPVSNLVLIDAHAPHPAAAAAIANAFAQEDASLSTAAARQTLAVEARNLSQKIKSLESGLGTTTTRLLYLDQLSRLEALSAVAAPVQVSGTATTPSGPSSPKTSRNVLVGILVGLMLGLVAAYRRRTLDQRLQSTHEIEEYTGLPLLGSVRNEALGRSMVANSNGIGRAEGMDAENFRILRQNVEYLDLTEATRCILVTSPNPEEGKSSVAAGLAMASATAGKLTVLLECDLRRPVLAKRFGLGDVAGLTDYLAGNASCGEILTSVPTAPVDGPLGEGQTASTDWVVGEGHQLVCITAGTGTARPAELLGSTRFQAMLSQLRETYEVVIIDSSPLLLVADTLELLAYVSDIVLCVRCDQTTRDQAKAARACLERVPAKPSGVVATGMRRGDGGYYAYKGYYSTRTAS